MQAEESFDSFYLATRRLLLHQTFALTGDVTAAHTAVRDAYVAAWHHWRKVGPLEDRMAWVRPRAWDHAQRRHVGPIRHRDTGTGADHIPVLDGLTRLTGAQRRVLLLVLLEGRDLSEAARELRITEGLAEQDLSAATASLSGHLGPGSTLGAALDGLAEPLAVVRLPRPATLRRAGRSRRRRHTAVALVAAVSVAVAGGALSYEPDAASTLGGLPTLAAGANIAGVEVPSPTPATGPTGASTEASTEAGVHAGDDSGGEAETATLPTTEDLLDPDQIRRLGEDRSWRVQQTHDNTSSDGLNTICQEDRFADPDGLAALVRQFSARGPAQRTAVQTVEISASAAQARKGFATTVGWYAGCRVARLQLLQAYRVDNVGSQAGVLTMRVWKRPVTTYSVAVARIGSVTTSTVARAVGAKAPPVREVAQSLADAVSMLCARSGAGSCSTQPELTVVPPPPSGEAPGILAVADLPPVGRIQKPWVGTKAVPARRNPSMTTCDRASFARAGAIRTRSRTYLIPQARLPVRFGLSEAYGVFRGVGPAQRFLDDVRDRVGRCEKRDLATEVTARDGGSFGRGTSWSSWGIATKVSSDERIRFRVGFVRVGARVAQLAFAPSAQDDMTDAHFRTLLDRAGDRLRELEPPRRARS